MVEYCVLNTLSLASRDNADYAFAAMKTPTAMIFCLVFMSWAAAGCGGSSSPACGALIGISVSPQTATVSHTAVAPGNQQQFLASPNFPAGCPPPPLPFGFAMWSVSDPVNVSISNARDQTNGTATCTGATAGAVTISANASVNGPAVIGTARLTCN